MTFLNQISLPSSETFGPAALAAVVILAAVLLARSGRHRSIAPAFVRRRLGLPKGVARWFVIGGISVAALVAVGIDLQGLWSTNVAGLSLIAAGFVAMWSILSHRLVSTLIVVFRPIEIGDRVEMIGDDLVVGEVTDLNPAYATLRTEDGGTLQMPNNLSFPKAVKRHVPTTLARSSAPLGSTLLAS
jgi:small-conductance mechanosensitive channel